MPVSFNISKDDRATALKIARRVVDVAQGNGVAFDVLHTQMDLIATHANGCPMDFARLLEADDFNLMHDIVGIGRHLDRETGKLTGGFTQLIDTDSLLNLQRYRLN